MATTTSPLRPRIFVAVSAVVVALLASVLVPIAASAAPVALTGTVVGPTGKAVPSLTVSVVRLSDEVTTATTKTSSSGSFTFAALPANNYTLKFPKTPTTFPQYLGGTSDILDSTPLTLVDAASNSFYVKAALSPSGVISGTVKKSTGSVLSGYQVRAYLLVDGDWTVVGTTTSSSLGTYTLASLEPGSYRLEARSVSSSPSTAPVFSGGVSTLAAAHEVLLPASTTKSYNFVFGGTGNVTGKVTGAFGGPAAEALKGVRVTPVRWLYPADPFSEVQFLTGLARTTSSTGSYSLSGLPPGRYTLFFEPRATAPLPASGTVYETVYLGGAGAADGATYFTVEAGKITSSKNIQLVEGGGLAGTVTLADNPTQSIPNLRVELVASGSGAGYQAPRVTHTDVNGHYAFTGLTTGLHYTITIGSFIDTPGDAVVENTSWAREKVGIVVTTAGLPTELNALMSLRQPVVPTSWPGIDAPDGWNIGDTVYADEGVWTSSGSPASYSYQWYRSAKPIAGATGSSYQLGPNDYETYINLRITRHDPAWGDGSYSAYGSQGELGAPLVNYGSGVILTGSPLVGSKLTVDTGTWTSSSLSLGNVTPQWDIDWYVGTNPGNPKTLVGSGYTHVVTGGDLDGGPAIWVEVTGHAHGFPNIVTYSMLSFPEEGSFDQVVAPSVTKSGSLFKLKTGTWTPTPTDFTIEWRVYETNGTYTTIPHATSLSTAGTAGKYVSVSVAPYLYRVNGGSVLLTAQKGSPFTVSGATVLAGTPVVGGGLSWPGLAWTPSPDGYSYAWQYLSGTSWKTITGTTGGGWVPTAGYLGKKVRLGITVNKLGYPNATKYSAAVTIGSGDAPVNTVVPVTSAPEINTTVTSDSGTWTLSPASYSYQWKYSATGAGAPFTVINGATAASYLVPGSLEGKHLWLDVTAKKPGHKSGTITVHAGQVMGGSLKNLTPPKVTKSSSGVLSVTNGTWAPTAELYDISWWVQNASGTPVLTSSAPTFDSTTTTWPIEVRVTAHATGYNDTSVQLLAKPGTILPNGSATIFAEFGKVDTDFTAYPEIGLLVGPTSGVNIALQWQYQNTLGAWVNIPGATNATFKPTGTAYIGKALRARLTRTVANWTTIVTYTLPQGVTVGAAPIPAITPAFVGTPDIGVPIAVTPVVWNMSGVATSYAWQTRAVGAPSWTTIVGATKANFTPGESLWGKELRVLVKGTKSGHTSANYIAGGDVVGDGQLVNKTAPTVTKSGNVLTASAGTWNATPTTVAYLWERWEVGTSSWVTIGSNSKSLTLTASETDKPIQLTVAVNRSHYAQGTHVGLARPGAAPTPLVPVTMVPHTATVGEYFQVYMAGWSVPSIAPTFAWFRNGVAIPGETAGAYTGTMADVGKTLSVKVTAGGGLYGTTTISLTVGVILVGDHPHVVTNPKMVTARGEGIPPRVGETVTVTKGTWNQTELTYFYEWRRDGVVIGGATSSSYTVTAADEGAFLTATVIAAKKYFFAAGSAVTPGYTVESGLAPVLLTPTSFLTNGMTGTGAFGTVHKAAALTFNVPVTVDYRWYYIEAGSFQYHEILGANSTSFTPVEGMATDGTVTMAAGGKLVLQVRATRPGHADYNHGSNGITLGSS